MKFKSLMNNIKSFNDNTRRFLDGKYIGAWCKEIYCAMRFGCSPNDFFRYEFYKKSNYERDSFITHLRSQKIIRKYNDEAKRDIFRDKAIFNQVFKDFIHREWIDLRIISQREFQNFVEKHNKVIMKPLSGGQGKGIFILTKDEIESVDLENYRNYIAEEVLTQHPVMNQLNQSCINTIRVLTFRGEIIACALRIGRGDSVVDNLHSNGVCAHLDIETGIIDAPCIDDSMNKYLVHPKSGMKLVGFEIPNWQKIQSEAVKAAQLVPEISYVGWDVALTEGGVAIIEGNHDPGHDLAQMISQSGLYKKIKKIEEERKR